MRAKPWITRGVIAAVAALPVTALALGLGRLTVDSGLGQPLSARIELTAVQKDELDSLTARVAEQAVYRDNNVQYPAVLTRARVSVEQGPGNVPYLRVSTQQTVNEPYLDLIIEVNWATGRVVRNYTFLLDPPTVTEKQAVEPVAPVRSAAAPARPAQPAQPREAQTQTPSARGGAGGDTYTVKRGDTLAKIALEYKPADVTLDQMLVALFRSNESAFDGRNMNRLRSGQILAIPPATQPGLIGPAEAQQIVRMQASDWRAYRDRVAATAPTTEAGASRQGAGGKITAAEEKAPAVRPGQDQLRVSREAGKGSGAAAAAAAEELAAKDKALRDANARIADLEKTLRDMQKAAELKSQTMAEVQKQAEAAKGEAAPAAAAPAPAATAAAPPAEPAPATTAPAAAPAPEAKAPEARPPETAPAETKAPEVKAPVKAPPKAPTQPSFFEDLLASIPTWAIGVIALVVLGGIGAIVAGRRRKTTKFEDSIISGTDIKTNTVFGSTGGGVVNTGDNSLASDFSREGLGSIDTDEVDPIAEAEVYLAYGRDAQAEEILKEALKKDPQRQEIYLKLLEIHAQHNKPSAFETVASELYSVSGGKGEVWQKAMALGRQLDPNNPLFSEAAGAAAFAAAAGTERAPAPRDEGAAPAHAAPPVSEARPPEPRVTKPVDLALDEDISISPTSLAVPPAAPPKTPASILAGAAQEVAKSTRATETRPAPGVTFGPESVPKFDLDFNLDEPSKPGPPMAPASPRPAAKAPAAAETAAPAPQLARPAAAIELDKLDLAFDPERSTFEDPTPSVLDGQWHDAATKLDLAKAYQEMGDVEGAREILQEVLHEGDDAQKAEAESLLSKLA